VPILNGYPPNSPRWWLGFLVHKLTDQQFRYDKLEDYHLGDHPLQVVDPKHLTAVKAFMKMAQTNYAMLVNAAPVGRMRVKDFEFGAAGEPDEDAKKIWAANDMDLQSKMLHSAASIFGEGYILVGPPDEQTGLPTMAVRDPRNAVVEPHPVFPTRSLAGLEMWQDVVTQQIMAVLYLPESIHVYAAGFVPNTTTTKESLTNRLLAPAASGGFEELLVVQNEIGEVPLIRLAWQPDYHGLSLGEAEPILHIQDRINQMILDRLVTASGQAFQKIWAKGIKDTKTPGTSPNKKGPTRPPYELGAHNLWITDSADAEFGAIPAVDFKQMLEAVRDDIADIAAITQTPAHYLMNRMVNVSGDTLTQAESGFVSKTKLRMDAMGWGWERVMRVAFKYTGNSKAEEPEVAVHWHNAMIRKDVDAADAASKWVAAGLELGLAMETYGDYTSEQIKFAREKKEEADQAAMEMQQQQLEIQKQSMAAKQQQGSQGSGKPASKSSSSQKK
jgi:hypothetical protein